MKDLTKVKNVYINSYESPMGTYAGAALLRLYLRAVLKKDVIANTEDGTDNYVQYICKSPSTMANKLDENSEEDFFIGYGTNTIADYGINAVDLPKYLNGVRFCYWRAMKDMIFPLLPGFLEHEKSKRMIYKMDRRLDEAGMKNVPMIMSQSVITDFVNAKRVLNYINEYEQFFYNIFDQYGYHLEDL